MKITEKRGLERRLVKKDRQLRECSQRSHELQHRVLNDLAGLSLHQLCQWRVAGEPDHCRGCMTRLDATIEMYRLLDRVAPSQVPLAPYLQAVVQTLQGAFAGDLEIESSLDPVVSLPRERASLVGLILHEAITNARKYAFPDGRCGRVRVQVQHVGNTLELIVSDDGVGFDPGRVYQQTAIDTYAKVAFAKLYDRKTPLTAADLMNDRVVPFFDEHEIVVSRVLTDRGTEYCGKPESHEYELYLAVENIDHTRTKARSPQTNGICERFHKTLLDEFYRVAFRKKLYRRIDELQADLDAWLAEYNEARPHQGRWCYGKTPMQTFIDTLPVAKEKLMQAA